MNCHLSGWTKQIENDFGPISNFFFYTPHLFGVKSDPNIVSNSNYFRPIFNRSRILSNVVHVFELEYFLFVSFLIFIWFSSQMFSQFSLVETKCKYWRTAMWLDYTNIDTENEWQTSALFRGEFSGAPELAL